RRAVHLPSEEWTLTWSDAERTVGRARGEDPDPVTPHRRPRAPRACPMPARFDDRTYCRCKPLGRDAGVGCGSGVDSLPRRSLQLTTSCDRQAEHFTVVG